MSATIYVAVLRTKGTTRTFELTADSLTGLRLQLLALVPTWCDLIVDTLEDYRSER